MSIHVGDLVYPAYKPQQAGVLVEVKQPPDKLAVCRSHRPLLPGAGIGAALLAPRCIFDSGHTSDHHDGSGIWWVNVEHAPKEWFTPMPTYVIQTPSGRRIETKTVRLFASLIEEHQKKLQTHELKRAELIAFRAGLELPG